MKIIKLIVSNFISQWTCIHCKDLSLNFWKLSLGQTRCEIELPCSLLPPNVCGICKNREQRMHVCEHNNKHLCKFMMLKVMLLGTLLLTWGLFIRKRYYWFLIIGKWLIMPNVTNICNTLNNLVRPIWVMYPRLCRLLTTLVLLFLVCCGCTRVPKNWIILYVKQTGLY